MSNSPCIYYDKQNHIWRFYVTDSFELVYSIMYQEDKWTKENKIDNEVLDFAVNIDHDGKIYIVYSITGGLLKYCILEGNRWLGKPLYHFENTDYQIRELAVNTIGNTTHVFFIAKGDNAKKKGILMHFSLNGVKTINNTIYEISLIHGVPYHYQVELAQDGTQYLLFISNENNQATVKFTEYKNLKWSIPKRLYGINGSNVEFCTLQHKNKINILNVSKEDSVYSLEHVLIDTDGKMKSYTIYEGSLKPYHYSLYENNKILYAMWIENDKILYCSYRNSWSPPLKLSVELNEAVTVYKYLSSNSKYNDIKAKYVLGTALPNLRLLLENTIIDYKDIPMNKKEEDIKTLFNLDTKKINESSKSGLVTIKKDSKGLDKKVVGLQLQLQHKQRIIEDIEGNLLRLSDEKRKVEERLNVIIDIHQTCMKELEESKAEKLKIDKVVTDLRNEVQSVTVYSNQLKKEFEEIKKEREELEKKLEYEKNKGVVDRIFKKRADK
ncbi:hypothetical protein [Clostridium algidicarnis]|uniref:hypothetical protein n=1 Tax=Clostridium algidicarnis TaxID=37659 RepID=UPI001C0B0AA2|nr:hypothetical protein [Clostridium algidicarnis]MBU3203858.1 hypothetical protein [Clostridium algidicarnis]MBU3212012.1 hypothetical protein [Clostridium algidicarnis]MBU3221482.1 hypothetical protein [Clostridium algidicarnis]